MKKLLSGVAALAVTAGVTAAPANANYNPGCVSQYWLVGLRGTTRTICDGPIRSDGSWNRIRNFYAPERWVPVSCSYSRYSSYCSGGYWLQEFDVTEAYPVTLVTQLPDEPGHIDEGVRT